MSLRRYVSLMHGLDYASVATDDASEAPVLSSTGDMRTFFGGAIRVSGGDS